MHNHQKSQIKLSRREASPSVSLGHVIDDTQCVRKKSTLTHYIVSRIIIYARIQNTISTVVAVWIITIISIFFEKLYSFFCFYNVNLNHHLISLFFCVIDITKDDTFGKK